MSVLRITPGGVEDSGKSLRPIIESLENRRSHLASIPVAGLLALLDDYSTRLLGDERTRGLEGAMFLAAWLKRSNLQKMLELNLNGNPAFLDGFVPYGRDFLAAKPQGLVAMWMAGNVATLPMFSLVPALLAKNICLVKLAYPEPDGMDRLLAVLADSQASGLRGADVLQAAAVVWFDYRRQQLNEEMSLAADAKIIWGGEAAIKAITTLPRREHCVEIIFGPKYSIGIIGRGQLDEGGERLETAIASFVRDIAIFDQRACSAPQTIFIERNQRYTLDEIGRRFASHLAKLPPKLELDPYTTLRILSARAAWALDDTKDVIASADGANWTVCMDREASLKEAVQSRTVFLSEVSSWREVIPLLSPKVQTIGMAMGDTDQAKAFAEAATAAGVARCVRPGLMNVYESPWDGKLLVSQLVRWVAFKP
jgi:hypothetical protein